MIYQGESDFKRLCYHLTKEGYPVIKKYGSGNIYLFGFCKTEEVIIGFCTFNDGITYSVLDGKVTVVLTDYDRGWDSGYITLNIPTNLFKIKFLIDQISILKIKKTDYKPISKYDYGFI